MTATMRDRIELKLREEKDPGFYGLWPFRMTVILK